MQEGRGRLSHVELCTLGDLSTSGWEGGELRPEASGREGLVRLARDSPSSSSLVRRTALLPSYSTTRQLLPTSPPHRLQLLSSLLAPSRCLFLDRHRPSTSPESRPTVLKYVSRRHTSVCVQALRGANGTLRRPPDPPALPSLHQKMDQVRTRFNLSAKAIGNACEAALYAELLLRIVDQDSLHGFSQLNSPDRPRRSRRHRPLRHRRDAAGKAATYDSVRPQARPASS